MVSNPTGQFLNPGDSEAYGPALRGQTKGQRESNLSNDVGDRTRKWSLTIRRSSIIVSNHGRYLVGMTRIRRKANLRCKGDVTTLVRAR